MYTCKFSHHNWSIVKHQLLILIDYSVIIGIIIHNSYKHYTGYDAKKN